jgi:hypothetical protein
VIEQQVDLAVERRIGDRQHHVAGLEPSEPVGQRDAGGGEHHGFFRAAKKRAMRPSAGLRPGRAASILVSKVIRFLPSAAICAPPRRIRCGR